MRRFSLLVAALLLPLVAGEVAHGAKSSKQRIRDWRRSEAQKQRARDRARPTTAAQQRAATMARMPTVGKAEKRLLDRCSTGFLQKSVGLHDLLRLDVERPLGTGAPYTI